MAAGYSMIDMDGIIGMRYKEKFLTIGNWALHLRDNDTIPKDNGYLAMIGHNCPKATRYRLRNGERHQTCTLCGKTIPDEIWGLWQLLCNDQRRRRE